MLLKVFYASPDEIQTRTRRLRTHKHELSAEAKIKRKRNRTELEYLSEVSAGELTAKFFDDALKEFGMHFKLLRLRYA